MKARSAVLYVSILANIALVMLVLWPTPSINLALAESATTSVGNLSAAVSKGDGSQDAVWIADRVSGIMAVYQHRTGAREMPIERVATVDLRRGLEQRQLGPLMLLPVAYSTNRAYVFVVDTDTERIAVYDFNRQRKLVEGVQQIDLRTDLGKTVVPAPAAAR